MYECEIGNQILKLLVTNYLHFVFRVNFWCKKGRKKLTVLYALETKQQHKWQKYWAKTVGIKGYIDVYSVKT